MSWTVWTNDSFRRLVDDGPKATVAESFALDPHRAERYSMTVGDLLIDTSKQLWDDDARRVLDALATESDALGAFRAMVAGARVNSSEGRSAGHVALRSNRPFEVDGHDLAPQIDTTRRAMYDFVEAVHSGRIVAADGGRYTDVVNVGIGGSDLGPRLVTAALRSVRSGGLHGRFVSNVDPADADDALTDLDPRRTLVVVSSKTMTTEETTANLAALREWMVAGAGDRAASEQFVAVTAAPERARSLGFIRVFPFWDWVGGRFSLASAVGLSSALVVGVEAFQQMLEGMRMVDDHTVATPIERNVPLQLALLGVWNTAVLGAPTRAVVPYSHDLRLLPAYLQQLVMESNGKSVTTDGSTVAGPTAPIVWGGAGTDGQHAYFQLLHQGTHTVPVDFIGFARPADDRRRTSDRRHDLLVANLVAQSRALAFGRPDDPALDRAEHRRFAGNRPSTVILAPRLDPSTLGQIVALYEHAVFFEAHMWGINPFDQWGVELGKDVARRIAAGDRSAVDDPSSSRLVDWLGRHGGTVAE